MKARIDGTVHWPRPTQAAQSGLESCKQNIEPPCPSHRRLRRRADGLTQGAAAVRYGAEGAAGEGAEPACPSALRAHRVAERRADVRRAGRLHHPAPVPAPHGGLSCGAHNVHAGRLCAGAGTGLQPNLMQCAREPGPGRAGYFPACNTPPPACARHQEGQSPEDGRAAAAIDRAWPDGTRRAMACCRECDARPTLAAARPFALRAEGPGRVEHVDARRGAERRPGVRRRLREQRLGGRAGRHPRRRSRNGDDVGAHLHR